MAEPDGHDAPVLIDELAQSFAAAIDEIVVEFEDTVAEPVVAHELPDILALLSGLRRFLKKSVILLF